MLACLWTRGLLWPLLVTLTLASNPSSPSPDARSQNVSYWVSFAKRITPGEPLAVHVYLANLSQPVHLHLELVDDQANNLQEGQNFTLQGNGDIHIIKFDVSKNLTRPEDLYSSSPMFIRVQASRGLEFDMYEDVSWKDLPLNVAVMTSTQEYEQGQTVKFIAFVTSGMQVVRKPMDILIRKSWEWPETKPIAELKQVQSTDKSGFYLGEFTLPSQASPDHYSIHVSAKDAQSKMETFQVKEYGKFRVKVDLPYMVAESFEEIHVNISTRTAVGFPVQGRCSVVATMGYGSYSSYTLVKNISLDKAGKGVVKFSRAELHKLGSDHVLNESPDSGPFTFNQTTFYFRATVTDEASGKNVTESASLYVDTGSNGLAVGSMAMNFKPGLSLRGYAVVMDTTNNLLGYNPNASVRLNVTYANREGKWGEVLQKDVRSGRSSYCFYTIDSVPADATALKIQGTRANSTHSVELPPFRSPGRSYLRLELKTTRVKVQGSVTIKVRSNIAFDRFTVQVYAKEALVMTKEERTATLQKVHTFTFVMTSEMAPVVDVIAFITTNTGEIVADRLPVGLTFSNDNTVKISFSKPRVTKGGDVRMTVEAKPRSRVFLMAGNDKDIYTNFLYYILSSKVTGALPGHRYSGRILFEGSWFYTGQTETRGVRRDSNGNTHHYLGYAPVADSFLVFTSLQASLITDGHLPGRSNASLLFGPQRPNATLSRSKREVTPTPGTTVTAPPATADDSQQNSTFFSETWLWRTVKIGKSGKKLLRLKAPDRMDTWFAFAMAVHPKLGLSWPESVAQLETTDSNE